MLKVLRNQKVQKNIYIFLAVVIVISFGISGVVLKDDKSDPSASLGTINGKNITVKDYKGSYDAISRQAQLIYGDAYDQIRPYINFRGEAWDRILLLEYAKKEGIKASDKEVIEKIASLPFFQQNGRFDQRAYDLVLQRVLRVQPRTFEEETRQMTIIAKIHEKLQSRMAVTEDGLKTLFSQQYGQRSIRYAVFTSDEILSTMTTTEDEIKKIYPMYQNRLTEPAAVKIRYIFISKADEEKSKDILADNASTLDVLSQKSSLKITETDFFTENDSIEGIGLEPKILEKCFSLVPKAISEWLDTTKGSYKIEVIDKKAEHSLSYEEALPQLKEILARQKAIEVTVNKAQDVAKKAKQSGFDAAMSEANVPVKTFDEFKADAYIPDLGPATSMHRAVSALKQGEVSDAIAIPGGAVIIQVTKDSPLDEKKFTAEKEAFRKKVLQDRSSEEMEKLLETLRKELVPNLENMKNLFPEEETSAPTN